MSSQELTPSVQALVEAVNRAKEEAVYSWLNLGKRLCELKEACPHGTFTRIAEEQCGLGKNQCNKLMRVYRAFGQKSLIRDFSVNTLLELSRAPDPEAALEEAKEHETLTAKQAREIAQLHKQIEAAKEEAKALEPNLSNLIPDLLRLHKSGGLPEKTALEFSKLDQQIQRFVVLPKYQEAAGHQKEIAKLQQEKTRALERESKEREKREALQADYDAAVESGAQEIIAEKEKEIQRKEKELNQLKVDMRAEIEENTGKLIEKKIRQEMQSRVDKAEEKAAKAEQEMADTMKYNRERSKEIERLREQQEDMERQLELSTATRVDDSRSREMAQVRDQVEIALRSIERDALEYGALMDKSLEIVLEISRMTAAFIEKQAGVLLLDQ